MWHFHFCQPPPQKKVQNTVFAPQQEDNRGTTDPHTRPKAYLTYAQQEDPIDSGTGHIYQTGAGPKHSELSCSCETFLHVALYVAQ